MKQDRLSRTLGAQFLDPYSGFRTNAVTCPTIADTVPTTNSFWPPSLGSLAAFLRPTDRLHSESCPLCVGLCTINLFLGRPVWIDLPLLKKVVNLHERHRIPESTGPPRCG